MTSELSTFMTRSPLVHLLGPQPLLRWFLKRLHLPGFDRPLGRCLHWIKNFKIGGRPWWVSRHQAETERLNLRKEGILSSAPAVWVLVVVIAIILPATLGM